MKRSISSRIFLAVTVFIVIVDSAFVLLNLYFSNQALDERFAAWAEDRRATYNVLLDETLDSMQVLAELFARDPQLHELFVRGRGAVIREGGGPGGADAAVFRSDLLERLQPAWTVATQDFDLRQLHFHIGPGSLSFLRVHRPDKFGDRMDNLRHIIVDSIADGQRRSGFELGRVYSGLRGVVPIFATLDRTAGTPIGAVEVGTSYQPVLETLQRRTGSNYAVLLMSDRVDHAMWAQFRSDMVDLSRQDLVVEAATSDCIAKIINAVPAPLFEDRRPDETRTSRVELADGRWIVVATWPLTDYLSSTNPEIGQPGFVTVCEDITEEIAAHRLSILTSVLYAIVAFLGLEVFLFAAIRIGTRHLQQRVDTATQSIRDLNVELKVRAETDGLTGLLNRNTFFAAADQLLRTQAQPDRELGIAMIDIDHFKRINDQYGHAVGDLVIRSVADSIRDNVREGDLVCRYGGEEFLVLTHEPSAVLDDDSQPKTPRAVGDRIHAAVRTLRIAFDHPDSPLSVTVSVGVTGLRPGEPIDHATVRADELLYEAKRGGRDWVMQG